MRTEPLDRYDDMLDLPHHEPVRHPRMPRAARAAQFAPFAALSGFDDLIRGASALDTEEK